MVTTRPAERGHDRLYRPSDVIVEAGRHSLEAHFSPDAAATVADVLLVGGGLANSLIALRLKARRPALKVRVLERAATPDDAHTWSFFRTDVAPATYAWLQPMFVAAWPGYRVSFPELRRRLATGYASLSSATLDAAVQAALGPDRLFGVEAIAVEPRRVTAADGRVFQAPLVIDGRGARPSVALSVAWQKFVGLEVRTAQPHGLAEPIVMDAGLPQLGGYRFLYVLPFAPDRLLIEDTRYTNEAGLDVPALTREIEAYAQAQGWRIAEVLRREQGVLPVTLGGDIEAFWAEQDDGVPRSGMRAVLFHPTTGYSLPDAAALAEAIAAEPDLTSEVIAQLIRERSIALWRERRFYTLLNRMLFFAAEPEQRWRVLARFHRLGQPLIERFYAARLTRADKLRILAGKPPVPIMAALRALPQSAAFDQRSVHAA